MENETIYLIVSCAFNIFVFLCLCRKDMMLKIYLAYYQQKLSNRGIYDELKDKKTLKSLWKVIHE